MATNRLRSRPGSTICFSASESNVTFDQAFRCPAFGTDALSALAFRAWLLTSHGVEGDGVPEGRVWERAVLELLAQGETNQMIAQRLFLSPKTVRNYVSNVFGKLQVADRAQAVVRARRAGFGARES